MAELSRDEERILESFDNHKPSDEQLVRIVNVRHATKHAAEIIILNAKPCADRTAALRLLHEAMMTANKAIALEASRETP